MPFETRETVFFVCPVCGEEYALPDRPTQNTTVKCVRESCDGRDLFVDHSGGQKPSEVPQETDLSPPSRLRIPEPIEGVRAKQPVSFTIASAILINLALIMTIVALLYLIPMIVYRCSEGEPPKAVDAGVGTDPVERDPYSSRRLFQGSLHYDFVEKLPCLVV